MVHENNTQSRSLGAWSPTLFLVGGALLIGHAVLTGVEAFTGLATPPDAFVAAGHLVGLAGLVELYPALVERNSRLARVAVAVAAVPLGGWAVMTAVQLLAVTGVTGTISDVLPRTVIMPVVVTTVLTYGLFGAATLRTDGDSRTVGLLVLAPAALITVLLAGAAAGVAAEALGFVVASGLALSMLALGFTLRTWHRPADRTELAGDAATG